MSLPGGWVGRRESVIDALIREIDEELGIAVEVGDLLCAAEIVNSSSRQDVELIFAATPSEPLDTSELTLIDPLGSQAADVLPPILGGAGQAPANHGGDGRRPAALAWQRLPVGREPLLKLAGALDHRLLGAGALRHGRRSSSSVRHGRASSRWPAIRQIAWR